MDFASILVAKENDVLYVLVTSLLDLKETWSNSDFIFNYDVFLQDRPQVYLILKMGELQDLARLIAQ